MQRAIFYDSELLKEKFPELKNFKHGSLVMMFEIVKNRFIKMLMQPEFRGKYFITEMDLCQNEICCTCYALVVNRRHAQMRLHYQDLDIRGYKSWLLTRDITLEGNEEAVLSLNQLFMAVLKECCVTDLKREVRDMLSVNSNHFVLIDDRRPFLEACC